MRLLFTVLLYVISLTINAQYIVRSATLTNRNDEIAQGTVRDYDWNKNPQTIEFSPGKTAEPKTISIREVKRLAFENGRVYEGLYLKVPVYAKEPIIGNNDLIERIDSSHYMAELLLDSEPVKLYRFFDVDDQVRFVVAKYDSLVLLNDIHVRLTKRSAVFKYGIPEYRKTLKTVLSECPALNTDEILYTEAGLVALVKEYLSFCRVDSRIYQEQKKFGKTMFGVGAFGSSWRSIDGVVGLYGVSVQVLFPRRFHNVFALADLGRGSLDGPFSPGSGTTVGLYAGRYFGRHAIQAKVYTGLSVVFGLFDTGVGVSYRKMFSAELRYPVMDGLLGGFRETDKFYIRPLLNFRAIIPLTKREGK